MFVMTDDIATKRPKDGGDVVAEIPVEKASHCGLKAFRREGRIEFSRRDAEVVTDFFSIFACLELLSDDPGRDSA